MTLRQTLFAPGEYYHLYSRGVDKRPIFLDQNDKDRFLRLLFICNGSNPIVYRDVKNLSLSSIETGDKIIAIGSYCLMFNHFHLLVREIKDGGITTFMRKLLTAYASYFNKKYDRTGALFGSEFKSEYLDTDEYLKYIFSYIHLNPLKILDKNWKEGGLDRNDAERFLDNYKESSYCDYVYLNGRDESLILNKQVFPEYFSSPNDFKTNLFEWFTPADHAKPSPM